MVNYWVFGIIEALDVGGGGQSWCFGVATKQR